MASGLGSAGRISKRLVLSYIIDWIVIIAIAAVGAAFSAITPNRRPFNVTDPDISFPYVSNEKISTGLLVVLGLVLPAVIVFVIAMFIGLGPATGESTSRGALLRRKLWEWNTGWMGLAVSLAIAFIITNGTKNAVGRPRPDLLARCNPDLTKSLASTVGGIGDQVDEGIRLVSWVICRNPGSVLDDGFRSFPSGHSSFSFAGLTYLALYICAKFAITLPFLNYQSLTNRYDRAPDQQVPNANEADGISKPLSARSEAAAPPTYLLIFPLIPLGLAIYVSSTRYSDFYHHGFDIIAGAILGTASAWLGFRLYHLPISRGGGWAWAPRSRDRAFGRGIGSVTYVSDSHDSKGQDLENGIPGQGVSRGALRSQQKSGDESGDIELDDMGDVRGHGRGRASDSSQRPLRF